MDQLERHLMQRQNYKNYSLFIPKNNPENTHNIRPVYKHFDFNSNSMENIAKLYEKQGYFDKYGGSVFISILSIVMVIVLVGYYYVKGNLQSLRQQWTTIRCSPQYMPFAGIIAPEPNKTAFETTSDNFTMCSNQILNTISSYETMPAQYSLNVVATMLSGINHVMNSARAEMDQVRNSLGKMFLGIYQKIESMIVPIHFMFLKQKDMLAKSQGVMTTILYTFLSAYLSLRTFIKAFLNIIILALIVFAAMIAILFLGFFSIPVAIALTVVFVGIAVPVGIVALWAESMLALTSPKIPRTPKAGPFCFAPETKMLVYRSPTLSLSKTKKAKYIPIRKIRLGDHLSRAFKDTIIPDKVNTIFEVDGKYSGMVKVNDVIMSGTHYVVWNGGELNPMYDNGLKIVDTARHPPEWFVNKLEVGHVYPAEIVAQTLNPNAYRIRKKYHRLYCVNTTSKQITFRSQRLNGNTITLDWDDLDDQRIQQLCQYVNRIRLTHYKQSHAQSHAHTDKSHNHPHPPESKYVSKVVPMNIPVYTKYNLSWIHQHLQYGLHGDSRVRIDLHGKTKKLKNMKVGDTIVIPLIKMFTSMGSHHSSIELLTSSVMGIVKIDASELDVYSYQWHDYRPTGEYKTRCWVGSSNCMRYIRSIEDGVPMFTSKRYDSTFEWVNNKTKVERKSPKILYNLITSSGLMCVNHVVMYDYNGGIDNILGINKLFIPKNC